MIEDYTTIGKHTVSVAKTLNNHKCSNRRLYLFYMSNAVTSRTNIFELSLNQVVGAKKATFISANKQL